MFSDYQYKRVKAFMNSNGIKYSIATRYDKINKNTKVILSSCATRSNISVCSNVEFEENIHEPNSASVDSKLSSYFSLVKKKVKELLQFIGSNSDRLYDLFMNQYSMNSTKEIGLLCASVFSAKICCTSMGNSNITIFKHKKPVYSVTKNTLNIYDCGNCIIDLIDYFIHTNSRQVIITQPRAYTVYTENLYDTATLLMKKDKDHPIIYDIVYTGHRGMYIKNNYRHKIDKFLRIANMQDVTLIRLLNSVSIIFDIHIANKLQKFPAPDEIYIPVILHLNNIRTFVALKPYSMFHTIVYLLKQILLLLYYSNRLQSNYIDIYMDSFNSRIVSTTLLSEETKSRQLVTCVCTIDSYESTSTIADKSIVFLEKLCKKEVSMAGISDFIDVDVVHLFKNDNKYIIIKKDKEVYCVIKDGEYTPLTEDISELIKIYE